MLNPALPAPRSSLSLHPDLALVTLLFAAGIFIRLLLLNPIPFDGLYGQDPYAYYDFAATLRDSLANGHPLPPFFWPLGYPALLAVTQTIFGGTAQTAQTLNILLGALLPVLVYFLARRMVVGRVGAFLAALLMLFCGQAIQSSLVVMADVPALFWATLSALLLWRYIADFKQQERITPDLLLAAFTLALAAITRWLYMILIVPWAAALLITWGWRIRWRAELLCAVVGMAVLVPQFVYSRTNPYPVFNHAWVEGWSPENAARQTFNNVDGHFEYEKINAVYYAQPFYDPYYLAPVFTPFIVLGLGVLLRQRRFAALVMLLGWALLPYLFLIGIPYQNIRFPLIVFPAVAILAGIGLEALLQWFSARLRRAGTLAVSALVVVSLIFTWSAVRPIIQTFIANQGKDKAAVAWAINQIPPGETIYTFGLTLTLQHYSDLNVYEIYYETPDTLAAKWLHGQPDYLLLNAWTIENQWDGHEPQTAYHWLRDYRGLLQLGKFGNYTLFRVMG